MLEKVVCYLLFGKKCKHCLGDLAIWKDEILCEDCLGKLEKLFDITKVEDDVYVVFPYLGIVQNLIQKGKYKSDKGVWSIWGRFLRSAFKDLKEDDFWIVPVPSSKERLKVRGFNQVELICKGGFRKNILKLVRRVKHVQSATLLSRKERLSLLRSCFEIDLACLDKLKLEQRKKIIVVDDVYTTGSTMNQMFEVLKSMEIEGVEVFGVCLASPRLNPP